MSLNIKNKPETKLYERFNSIPFNKGVELLKRIQEKGVIIFGSSGEMGSKIASCFPKANILTILQDIDEEKLKSAKTSILKTFEKALKRKKISKRQLDLIKEKSLVNETITFPEKGKIPFLELSKGKDFVKSFLEKVIPNNEIRNSYSNAMMVLEASPENLSFKQNVFKFFELALNNEAILATNTSSLNVSDIAKNINEKNRSVGFHFFLPAHINPLIEIIVGDKTSPEVVQAMHNLAISMGKKPIICWGDSPGAIANRILVGVLNEAARIYDEFGFNANLIDKVFLETFYSKQIKIQTKKAKNQFKAAPKLGFFSDEVELYEIIKNIDTEISKNPTQHSLKKELLEKAEGTLRQKVLYAQIVENHSSLGTFFTPAPVVSKVKAKAQEQMTKIREYLNKAEQDKNTLLSPCEILPYELPEPVNKIKSYKAPKEIIRDRLLGAYIAICQEIYKEELGTIQDIELACKEGFKWNSGPFELINILGKDKVEYLTTLINTNIDQTLKSGISKSGEVLSFNENELSGIETYIQNNIGFIVLGRLHIQNLQMIQNSLSPQILESISKALKDFEQKQVKSIIIKSQGGGPFSAGADLNYIESTNWDIQKIINYINFGKKVMAEIANNKIPTTVIIDGAAVGGGLELALACDYRIMTDLSYCCLPEVSLGIIPDWGGTERLPALIGKELAKRIICTATLKNLGLKLSAEDAYELGLADAFVLQSELPSFIVDLIDNKGRSSEWGINIYKKPERKSNYNKNDYSEKIVTKFKLDKPFKHNFRVFTKYAAKLAEDLINHSDEPNYSKKINNDFVSKTLLEHGKNVAKWQVNPFLWMAQNKFLAPQLEKFGLL